MNISHSIPATVGSISFSFLSTEDVRRISVKQIVNPVLLDDLNRPNIGGLYDPALGPSDKKDMYVRCSRVSDGAESRIAVALHADSPTSHVQAILVTLSSLLPCFTRSSYRRCTTCLGERACSVIGSKRADMW